jgi:hypothetical protein
MVAPTRALQLRGRYGLGHRHEPGAALCARSAWRLARASSLAAGALDWPSRRKQPARSMRGLACMKSSKALELGLGLAGEARR